MVLLSRILIGLLAFVVASVLAATYVTLLGNTAFGQMPGRDDLASTLTDVIPSYALIFAFLTTALALFLLSTYGLRRWRHFAIGGAIIGFAGFAAMFAPVFLDDARDALSDTLTYRVLWGLLVSGAAGGTGYWLVALKAFGREKAEW